MVGARLYPVGFWLYLFYIYNLVLRIYSTLQPITELLFLVTEFKNSTSYLKIQHSGTRQLHKTDFESSEGMRSLPPQTSIKIRCSGLLRRLHLSLVLFYPSLVDFVTQRKKCQFSYMYNSCCHLHTQVLWPAKGSWRWKPLRFMGSSKTRISMCHSLFICALSEKRHYIWKK